jgi:hypothetical protein
VMFVAPKGRLVLCLPILGGRGAHSVVCFGPKKHYRKDGMCRDVDEILARMKPWYRSRARVDRWGGEPPVRQTSISGARK